MPEARGPGWGVHQQHWQTREQSREVQLSRGRCLLFLGKLREHGVVPGAWPQ
jgi:hypothetical protein